LIKAVATALVLIAGAAVVLWYGNTLNSWILGGLIGGLAALLLSIPISLTIFSYFSRRHDEQLKATSQEHEDLAPPAYRYDYAAIPPRVPREVYRIRETYDPYEGQREVYSLEERSSARAVWDEEEQYPSMRSARQLPAPYPRYLASGYEQDVPRLPAPRREQPLPPQPPVRAKDASGRYPTPRRINYPGFPGYQAEGTRSRYRSEALRNARIEAAQQHDDNDFEGPPTSISRRARTPRSSQPLDERNDRTTGSRSSRQLPQQAKNQYPRRSRRSIDDAPPPASTRRPGSSQQQRPAMPAEQSSYFEGQEPQTDHLDPAMDFGDLRKPLLRRAPYMYEDDPLREEMAQKAEPPITRRSSRYLDARYHDYEE